MEENPEEIIPTSTYTFIRMDLGKEFIQEFPPLIRLTTQQGNQYTFKRDQYIYLPSEKPPAVLMLSYSRDVEGGAIDQLLGGLEKRLDPGDLS